MIFAYGTVHIFATRSRFHLNQYKCYYVVFGELSTIIFDFVHELSVIIWFGCFGVLSDEGGSVVCSIVLEYGQPKHPECIGLDWFGLCYLLGIIETDDGCGWFVGDCALECIDWLMIDWWMIDEIVGSICSIRLQIDKSMFELVWL